MALFEGPGRRMLWSKWWSFESSYMFASLHHCNLCWVATRIVTKSVRDKILQIKRREMENKKKQKFI